MIWFQGLEGARAWLAWIVVASHLAAITGLGHTMPIMHHLQDMADTAVLVFIIISGFVITHLLISKHERYGLYIFRRFMRLYPVYIVCLVLGVFITLSFTHMLSTHPWGDSLSMTPRMQNAAASIHDHFFAHLGAHLTLLHGAISNHRLLESEYAFLSPAWSLSLEWQFYLIAPLIMFALRRNATAIVAVLIAGIIAMAYQHGLLGSFILPSFLPGSVFPFAAGIATRLAVPTMHKPMNYPIAVVLLALMGVYILAPSQLHYATWFALVLYMTSIDKPSVLRATLDSPVANWMGRRSYATYLVHVPVIQYLLITAARLHLDYRLTVIVTALCTPVIVFLVADILHRLVELPGVELGNWLANRTRLQHQKLLHM